MKRLTTTLTLAILAFSGPALAQNAPSLIYSDTVQESDPRSDVLDIGFAECLGDAFAFQPYHGATLVKQGTELTSMQRGNLDMASLAVFDFYNQVPATSILGTAYLFRDVDHMRKVFNSDVLDDLVAQIEGETGIKILSWPYIGTRHVNIRGDKVIKTPADLAGIKLRMPGGEGWQFLGEALGANPTPMAFTEVYTALQTGAIDGQDNPLPTDKSMKFYEVTDQIVLTGHRMSNNVFAISASKWNSLDDAQQQTLQTCADGFEDDMANYVLKQEEELTSFFESEGLKVYAPDTEAFRNHVLKAYQASKFAADWPVGLFEKINGL